MAKKSIINRNEKRKKIVARYAERRNELKKAMYDPSLSYEEREIAAKKLRAMPRDSAPIRVRNRCQITGRPRGIYKKFMLSRMKLRELAHEGMIPGVTKSSW